MSILYFPSPAYSLNCNQPDIKLLLSTALSHLSLFPTYINITNAPRRISFQSSIAFRESFRRRILKGCFL